MRLWIDTFILVLISDISLRAFYKYFDKEGKPSLILMFISDICFFILLIVYTNFVVKYFV